MSVAEPGDTTHAQDQLNRPRRANHQHAPAPTGPEVRDGSRIRRQAQIDVAPGASVWASPAISVSGVVKQFGDVRALDSLDLVVPRSVTFGLLGPNGAGKSTLMRLLTGTAVPTAGNVEVLGLPLPEAAVQVRSRTGLVAQADNLDDELTCAESLTVYARLYGIAARERADAVAAGLAFARLSDRADTLASALSGGMRRRLQIARGLLHRPDLVLLDEPTVGLDPQIRHEVWRQIHAIRASGATVVLTTHYIEEAERLCDDVAIVDHGRVLARGRPDRLVADHVGSDLVVEVHGDDALRRRVQAAAAAAGIPHRSAGTAVAAFTSDLEAAIGDDERLAPGDLDHHLRRPANLEDVFVSLTGELLS
jgi:lipooligosaccharide transport system ATP-binding protein